MNTTEPNAALTPEYIRSVSPTLCADLAHWADYGIYTVGAFNDYLDIEAAHNIFKDENGFRPRHIITGDDARAYLESRRPAETPAPSGKARIRKNRWDNWYGYIGNRRVIAFASDFQGTAEQHAARWLEKQREPRTPSEIAAGWVADNQGEHDANGTA